MSQSKKEMMNRALSAMTINIGKAGVNDNLNLQKISLEIKILILQKLSKKLDVNLSMLEDMLL